MKTLKPKTNRTPIQKLHSYVFRRLKWIINALKINDSAVDWMANYFTVLWLYADDKLLFFGHLEILISWIFQRAVWNIGGCLGNAHCLETIIKRSIKWRVIFRHKIFIKSIRTLIYGFAFSGLR